MSKTYTFSLGAVSHADLEEWAGRGLTEAQANLLFEQIQSEVDDNIAAHCTNVITDFDFGDEPGLEGVPSSPPISVRESTVEEYQAMLEEVRARGAGPAPEEADETNTNDKKYPIISGSLTYVTREDLLEWWDEAEDGPLTDDIAERLALDVETSIEDMLSDRWKDMMRDAVSNVLETLTEED